MNTSLVSTPSVQYELKYWPDQVLRTKCEEVDPTTIQALDISTQMIQIMRANKGAGLAAPQVGCTHRIFVMRDPDDPDNKSCVFINPEIIESSDERLVDSEGCLSFPGQRVRISRAKAIDIKFVDLEGEELEWHFEGFYARCVQHEIDHLDGIMIFDHINSNLVQKMTLDKYFKKRPRS